MTVEQGRPRDWDAATYDLVADPMARWGVDVLARLELAGDERVLDAGCGSGRVTEQLLGRLPEAARAPFVEAVAAHLPQPEIDYVRLNIVARRVND
ncbi:MAG: hypothetical protein HY332_07280 [Chloroflexi bacterium]|nr:hypothetical protein [Chloroflexota bacterium]